MVLAYCFQVLAAREAPSNSFGASPATRRKYASVRSAIVVLLRGRFVTGGPPSQLFRYIW